MEFEKFLDELRIDGKPFKPNRCQIRLMEMIKKAEEGAKRSGEKPRFVIFKPTGRPWYSTFPGLR